MVRKSHKDRGVPLPNGPKNSLYMIYMGPTSPF